MDKSDEAAGDEEHNDNDDNFDQDMVGVDIIKAVDGQNPVSWEIIPQLLPEPVFQKIALEYCFKFCAESSRVFQSCMASGMIVTPRANWTLTFNTSRVQKSLVDFENMNIETANDDVVIIMPIHT